MDTGISQVASVHDDFGGLANAILGNILHVEGPFYVTPENNMQTINT